MSLRQGTILLVLAAAVGGAGYLYFGEDDNDGAEGGGAPIANVNVPEPFRHGRISFALQTRQGPHDLGTIAVRGSNSAPIDAPIRPLPPANVPEPDRNGTTRLTLVMQDGAMGGRHVGSDCWAFNDRSGLPERPWRRFARGETARIVMRNDTAFPHGIHLHGHHFHELREDGAPGHYRDTTLVEPRQSREVLCVFDNPGKWLLHCHTLGHQASGMKTWVEVA